MYSLVKNILRKILPVSVFFRVEVFFRYFHYLTYKGSKFKCPVCEKNLRGFQIYGYDKICPSCGSLGRNRRLYTLLKEGWMKEGISVLDFSPSRCVYRALKKENIKYIPTDLSGDFIAEFRYDITSISLDDNSIDLIICYHILEHVIDDVLAMKELFRVLKTNGMCVVQTPFKEGDIYEDYSKVSDADRLKCFGQEDHVRVYSIKGLKERLEKAGFFIEEFTFNESSTNYYGYDHLETILVCKK